MRWKLFLTITLSFACFSAFAQKSSKHPGFSYKIFEAEQRTWGYDIFRAGQKFIHQPNVPVTEGMRGFSTKEKAARAASLVIKKLRNGEMPPTISRTELENIKAL